MFVIIRHRVWSIQPFGLGFICWNLGDSETETGVFVKDSSKFSPKLGFHLLNSSIKCHFDKQKQNIIQVIVNKICYNFILFIDPITNL